MCENGLEACIAGDVLDEVAKYLDDGDLISSLAPASRTLATAVDHCAARRCRALWSTSAEIEARGVRLGSAFLARRSRPVLKTHGPMEMRLPLASKLPQQIYEDSDSDEDEDEDRYLLIDVNVKTRAGVIVGRRSVMMDCVCGYPFGGGELQFAYSGEFRFDAPLTIAENLKPWNFYARYSNVDDNIESGWYCEMGNIVGTKNCVHGNSTYGFNLVNHNFPDELMAAGLIDRYRRSQLPSSRVVVSVRVDLFRKDGESMCLFDGPVGIPGHDDWPEQGNWDYMDDTAADLKRIGIPLEAADTDINSNLLPPGDFEPSGYSFRKYKAADTLHCSPVVFAKYPEGDRGAFELVAVRLGFNTERASLDEEHLTSIGSPHMGGKVVQGLYALDAWS